MPRSLLVIAAPGIKVPIEDKPRDYITDADAVEVPETAYNLRRVADGDLVIVEPATQTSKATKTKDA